MIIGDPASDLVNECAAALRVVRARAKLVVPFPRDELVAQQLEIFRTFARRARDAGLSTAPSDLMMLGYSIHAALAALEAGN